MSEVCGLHHQKDRDVRRRASSDGKMRKFVGHARYDFVVVIQQYLEETISTAFD